VSADPAILAVWPAHPIRDFCWACFVEFDRTTGHECPPERLTPHR
jgi:hypothetical protein